MSGLACIADGNGIYVCVDKVTPVATQCIQVVQVTQPVEIPKVVDLLTGGQQVVSYIPRENAIVAAVVLACLVGFFAFLFGLYFGGRK